MYHRILVPLDGSATAARGLQEAITLAGEQKASLHLMSVVEDYPMLMEATSALAFDEMRNALRSAATDLLAKARDTATAAGVPAETALREVTQGRIADLIVDEARQADCDLIVMGTHGRRGFSRFALGSDAELTVRLSPVPVLLVRQEPASAP